MGYWMQTSVIWKIKVCLSKLWLLRLKFLPEKKINNPALVENVSFSLELELGTYKSLYLFESSMN